MHLHVLLPAVLLAIFSQAVAQALPPASSVSVESIGTENAAISALSAGLKDGPEALVATGGSGCKANSVAHAFNGDRTVLTLIFSDLITDIGPGVPPANHRRFCAANIKMKVPAGWTFQVSSVDWRGYVDLDKGVRGVLGSTYFWTGRRDEKTNIHKAILGPIRDSYLKHQDGEKDAKAVWLPCSEADKNNIHINTAIRLTNSKGAENAKGSITVDSIDAKFKQHLNLGWKKC